MSYEWLDAEKCGHAKLYEKDDPLKAPGSVARFLRNSAFILINDNGGDASVPTPHNPTPAPTGTRGLPRRYYKISALERSLRTAKPATQQEAVWSSGIFFCLEALDGAFGDFEAGFEDGFFIVAHEHLIFEEARATGGTRGILLARPFHVLKLVK